MIFYAAQALVEQPHTVFPHIRPLGIIILISLQMRVLLKNTTFLLHKIVRIAGIIRGRPYMRKYGNLYVFVVVVIHLSIFM